MRVAQVVPHIFREASGPSYSVRELCNGLVSLGAEVELHVLAPLPEEVESLCRFRVVAHRSSRWPERLGRSPSMFRALRSAAERVNVLHSHSLWMLPNVYPGWVAKRADCPLVMSPRGTLSSWAMNRSRVRKRLFWPVQRVALRRASCLHATGGLEAADIRRCGFAQPIAVIPNGIDVPVSTSRRAGQGPSTLLFLGRLHPVKGLDDLITSWSRVHDRFPNWRLLIAGPDDDGYLEKVRGLARTARADRVELVGPVYGEEKAALLEEADLLVLPSHSENFGMVVAEALARGTPTVVSTGAPWEGLTKHRCGWWYEGGAAGLERALSEALALAPERLRELGERGRAWMVRDFSWANIAGQMGAVYQWLADGGPAPACVRLD